MKDLKYKVENVALHGATTSPEESDWVQEEYDHWLDEIERIQELNLIQFQQELHKSNKQ